MSAPTTCASATPIRAPTSRPPWSGCAPSWSRSPSDRAVRQIGTGALPVAALFDRPHGGPWRYLVADRPRVFVSRRIPEDGLKPIVDATDADVWQDDLPPPRDELLRRIEGMDGVLALLTDRVDAEFFDRAGPQLKVVSNYAVGFDNIVVPE